MANKAEIREKFDVLQEKVFDYLHGEKPENNVTACCMANPSMTGSGGEVSKTFAAFIGPRQAEELLGLCGAFKEYCEASGCASLQEVVLNVGFPVEAYEEWGVPESLGSDDGHSAWEADMRWLPRPSDDEPCDPFRIDLLGMAVDENGVKIKACSHYGDGEYEFRIYASTLREIAAGLEAKQESAPAR